MLRIVIFLALAALTSAAPATAAEFGTKAEAIAMVKRSQDQFKKDGPDIAFKAVSDKSNKAYQDRDLYRVGRRHRSPSILEELSQRSWS
jgi:ABC-type glycerol-3-phosphate transport system substrate-binding protein